MGGPPPPTGTPASRRAKSRAVIIAVVVVVIIVIAIGSYVYLSNSQTVQVNAFIAYAPNNVCGLNINQVEFTPGFSDAPGASDQFEFIVPNYNLSSCTVRGVTTNTSGFTLSDVQVPVTIAAATIAGPGEGYLNLTVNLPGSGFNGNLNLVFS